LKQPYVLFAVAFVAWAPQGQARAEQAPFQRVELQRLTFPPDNLSFLDLVAIAVGGGVPRDAHPAQQIGYVLEGEAIFTVEGQPDIALKPGMSFKIPAGAPHSFKNAAASVAKLLIFGVEREKPPGAPTP